MQISSYIKSDLLSNAALKGDIIPVKTTQDKHYSGKEIREPDNSLGSFAGALMKAVEKVNDDQIHSQELTRKMVADPSSVNMHSVMISLEKARMSITFAKTVTDLGVRAYNQLVNMR